MNEVDSSRDEEVFKSWLRTGYGADYDKTLNQANDIDSVLKAYGEANKTNYPDSIAHKTKLKLVVLMDEDHKLFSEVLGELTDAGKKPKLSGKLFDQNGRLDSFYVQDVAKNYFELRTQKD